MQLVSGFPPGFTQIKTQISAEKARLKMSLNKLWALVLSFTASNVVATTDSCAALTSLSLENTTIVTAYLQKTGANASTPLSCSATGAENLIASADVCRIHGYINTTAISSLVFEAWLPDIWYGRFIGLGNGGLGGCKSRW